MFRARKEWSMKRVPGRHQRDGRHPQPREGTGDMIKSPEGAQLS